MTRRVAALLLGLVLLVLPAASTAQLAEADRAWAMRAERLDEGRADPARIEESVALYRQALARDADSLEARWKLLRALHYLLDFTTADEPRKEAGMEKAIAVARDAAARLEAGLGDPEERARLYFWSAIVWGARAQRVGLLTVVREGVAGRMHRYAERTVALDPDVDRGGALRLLSRMHAELPRVPLVSGWVDRAQVLPLAERAHARDPDHAGNRLVLALALLEQAPGREDEARVLLEGVAASEPEPGLVAESFAIREQARKRLAALGADAS